MIVGADFGQALQTFDCESSFYWHDSVRNAYSPDSFFIADSSCIMQCVAPVVGRLDIDLVG